MLNQQNILMFFDETDFILSVSVRKNIKFTIDQIQQPNFIKYKMRNFGIQNNRSSPSYRADTSQHKRNLLDVLKTSENLWRQERSEQSLIQLKKAISLLKFIIVNESIQSVKTSYQEKLQELEKRIVSRENNQFQQRAPNQQVQKGNKGENEFKGQMNQNILVEKPNVKWDDISGLEGAKAALKEAVIMPVRFKKMFTGPRQPWKGILLYGPPGTGKTFLAKACATEADTTFFSIESSKILSRYVGDSQKMVNSLFTLAREKKPSIIFIDEIDALCSSRSEGQNEATKRVKSQFLTQTQGVGNENSGVLILGATNFPESLDFAIRRRFQRRIYIALPEYDARYGLLKRQLKTIPHELTEQNFQELASATEGYSGSDIKALIKDAVYQPMRVFQNATRFIKLGNGKWRPCKQDQTDGELKTWIDFEDENDVEIDSITFDDFMGSITHIKPSVDQKILRKYEDWTKEYGQDG